MLFLEIDMCMAEVHIHFILFIFFVCLEYNNLSTSGGVKIWSLCPKLYIV